MNPTSNCSHRGGQTCSEVRTCVVRLFRVRSCSRSASRPALNERDQQTNKQRDWAERLHPESHCDYEVMRLGAVGEMLGWSVSTRWRSTNKEDKVSPANTLTALQNPKLKPPALPCNNKNSSACFLGAVGEFKVPGLSLQLKSKQVQTNEIKKKVIRHLRSLSVLKSKTQLFLCFHILMESLRAGAIAAAASRLASYQLMRLLR